MPCEIDHAPAKYKTPSHGAVKLSCSLLIKLCRPKAIDGKMLAKPIHNKYLGALKKQYAEINTPPTKIRQKGTTSKKYCVSGKFTKWLQLFVACVSF